MTTRHRFIAARLAYVVAIMFATMSNLDLSADLAAASQRLSDAFMPSIGWRDAVDGLRNLALFAGLGGVWVMTSLSSRIKRELWHVTLTGFVVSVCAEGLQVFSPVRTASIVDVATNTVGAFVGAVITAWVLGAVQRGKGAKSYVGVPTMLLAGPYLGAVLCEALAPLFGSEPLPRIQGGPRARLLTALAIALPLDWQKIPVLDVPLFVVGGFLLVALRRERAARTSAPYNWASAAVLGSIVIACAHVVHGTFALTIRWEAVAVDALSFAFGAWAADHWLGAITQRLRGPARARMMIVSYAVLLVIWGWRPLLPELRGEVIARQLRLAAFIPLASLSSRVDVFSVLHVAQQFLLYVPLGAILAVWPLRLAGRLAGLWPAVWLAVVIEVGHIVMAGWLFDMTNAILACAGLGLGWLAVRRSGFTPYGVVLPSDRRRAPS